MEDTKIQNGEDFEEFQTQAAALIKWHFLQAGYVHINSLREASILFRILQLIHDPDKLDYHKELDNLVPYNYGYLKGLRNLGEEQFENLEEILKSLPMSDERKYIEALIENYKANSFTDTNRKYRIGTLFHIHAEGISDLHLTENGIKFQNEMFSNYPNTMHRMDIWLNMNDELEALIDKNLLDSLGLKLSEINEFAIDFTALAKENIHVINKLNKFYQRDDRPLLIVIYGKYDSATFRKVENDIRRHKDGSNVRLITLNQYLELFKFPKSYIDMMTYLSSLASLALKGRDAFNKLRDFDIHNAKILQRTLFDYT